MYRYLCVILAALILSACGLADQSTEHSNAQLASATGIDPNSGVYEVAVKEGLSYEDVSDSLKTVSEGMNFVNSASFHIGENLKKRGIDPQGIKEVRGICNLGMGTEIILDHPEFLVFAPCRIAIYEKLDANNVLKLYVALARPTHDLKSIKNPTPRAQKSAQELESVLIELVQRASEGDF